MHIDFILHDMPLYTKKSQYEKKFLFVTSRKSTLRMSFTVFLFDKARTSFLFYKKILLGILFLLGNSLNCFTALITHFPFLQIVFLGLN